MSIANLKILLKKFSFIWRILLRIKKSFINLSRLKDVLAMMLFLHIWPEQVFRFSTRKFLPDKKNKFFKNSKPNIPYELLNKKNDSIPKMKEIHVVGIGASFDLNTIKHIDDPVFLVSFWAPLHMDVSANIIYSSELGGDGHINRKVKLENLKEIKKKNYTYVHSRREIIESFKKKGHNVLAVEPHGIDREEKYFPFYKEINTKEYLDLFNEDHCKRIPVVEKVFKPPLLPPNPNWAQTGSFLPALCALTYFAEKVHVYGWDFFLNESPDKMSYWKLFFKIYKYKLDTTYRAKSHFEEGLVNFYYGFQLSKLPNIKIHGYLGKLNKHEKLIKKIERVLFN